MTDKPLDCVGVPVNGVGKHDFRLNVEKGERQLFGTLTEAPGLFVTADSEPELNAEAINGLAALLKVERERVAALHAKLDAIRGVLIPVSEDIWHGKWRVNRAIELARE